MQNSLTTKGKLKDLVVKSLDFVTRQPWVQVLLDELCESWERYLPSFNFNFLNS